MVFHHREICTPVPFVNTSGRDLGSDEEVLGRLKEEIPTLEDLDPAAAIALLTAQSEGVKGSIRRAYGLHIGADLDELCSGEESGPSLR